MLTKKMDPPAPLHPGNYHDDDHGYAILDHRLSFDNVRDDDAGAEVAAVHEENSVATRPDPSVAAELTTKTNEAAISEEAFATLDGTAPNVDSPSAKSEPSPLSLRPDDLADSVLESIDSMNEDGGKIDEQPVEVSVQPLGMNSPSLNRAATKVKTVYGGGEDDDDDFTLASQESDSPLMQALNEAVAAAAAESAVPTGSVGSSEAKDNGVCDALQEAPELDHKSEAAETPAEPTEMREETKTLKRAAKSRMPFIALVVGIAVAIGLASTYSVKQPGTIGNNHQDATTAMDLDEATKIPSVVDGSIAGLLEAGLDDSLTHSGFKEEALYADATHDFATEGSSRRNDSYFLATEEPSYQDVAHAFAVEPLNIQFAPTPAHEQDCEEDIEEEGATEFLRFRWSELKKLFSDARSRGHAFFTSPEHEHKESVIEDAIPSLQMRWFDLKGALSDSLASYLPALPTLEDTEEVDATQSEHLPTRWFDEESKEWQLDDTENRRYLWVLLGLVLLMLAGMHLRDNERRERNDHINAQVQMELRRRSSVQSEAKALTDNDSRYADFAVEMMRISAMLERSGRSGIKNVSALTESKTYDEISKIYHGLTSKDLRLILKSLFGHVAPARATKAELVDWVVESYEIHLHSLKKIEIRAILESKSVRLPLCCTKKQLIACALHVGF